MRIFSEPMPLPYIWIHRRSQVLAWLLLFAPLAFGESLLPFLERLHADNRLRIAKKLSREHQEICRRMELSPDDSSNQARILQALFLHRLLTTSAPADGTRGGILESVYFWHWVTPNPRHQIRRLPDSALLAKCKPHPQHAMYRSWADMDRTPDLFLADLVSDSPRYFHPDFGSFFTFGWCSEREMAFSLLLIRMGYVAKIKFQGNHVWTEVLISGKGRDGSTKSGILRIDNTFGEIGAQPLDKPMAAWLADLGPGKDVVGMNAKTKAKEQVRRVDSLDLGIPARARIEGQVAEWLKR